MKQLLSRTFPAAMLTLSILFLSQALISGDTLGTWTDQNLTSTDYDLYGMAYGNDTFVAVGEDYSGNDVKYYVGTSPDGQTWVQRTAGSKSSTFNQVIFSLGRFIAVCKMPDGGGARIFISDSNGAKWKSVASGIDEFGNIVEGGLHAVASNGSGVLIAVGGTPYGSGWITRSTDNGSTWNVVKTGVGGAMYGVGYGAGQWFAFSGSSSLRSSDGGTTWNAIPGGPTVSDKGYKLATDGRQIVVATATGPKWSGDGGNTWNSGTAATGFEAVGTLDDSATSVIYADDLFVLVTATAGDVWTSETGVTWKRWKLPSAPPGGWMKAHALCHAKKSFWCGGWFGLLGQSPKWFKPRLGLPGDYPFTLFDGEDGPPRRIGLPTYRVNTSALNLILEGSLFYSRTWNMPVHLRLAYGSAPCPDGSANIGLFGKNWRFRYQSLVGRFGQEAQLLNGAGRSILFTTPGGEDLDSVGSEVTLVSPPGNFDTLVYKPSVPSFELTLAKQRLTYVYSAVVDGSLFHLTEIRDRFGNKLTCDVNTTNGRINWLRDPLGQQFTLSYNGAGLCSGISMPDGRTVGFTYDAAKNLTGMTDMMGYAASYVYDADGFLTSMTTAGKTNTFAYEPRPGYEDPATENAGDQYVSRVTRPDGSEIRYELLDEGESVRRIGAGGAITTFSNEKGNTTRIVDPMGNLRNIAYNEINLPSTVADGAGAQVSYQYDERGNVTEMTTPLGHATAYTYDGHDNLLTQTDPLGNTWTFTYDGSDRMLTATSPLGHATLLAYFNQAVGSGYNGLLQQFTDPRSKVTTLGYDGFGNVASITDPVGGVSAFVFDARGYRCTGITDANGKAKAITWDNNDRPLTITYTSAAGAPSRTYTYNAFGQIGLTDELGKATTIARDSFGLPTRVTDPLGNVSLTEYDDDLRPIRQIDPLGRATSTAYDDAGRPTINTDARGYDFVRGYDGSGNLISVTDRNRAKTTYAYDADNRLTGSTDPLKKTTAIAYDPASRPTTRTTARGQQVTMTYDDDNRLTVRSHKASAKAAAVNAADYTYDNAGNITSVTDAWGVTDMEYDDAGRLTKITYPNTGGTRHEASFTWKPGGQLATIAYPGGFIVGYTYDNFNRLQVPRQLQSSPQSGMVGDPGIANRITQVTMAVGLDPQGDFTLAYDNRASLTRIDRPNLTRSDYAYDDAGRLTQIAHTDPGTATNLLTADYTLDAIGNPATETLTGAYAVTAFTLPATMAFAYNAAGQLTAKDRQKAVSDADGNLIKIDNSTTAEYDAENHLTKLVRKTAAGTVTTTYTVNHAGLVVKRDIDGEVIHYHYGPGNVLLFTTDGNGDVIDCHAWLGRLLLATRKADASYVHYYGDRQGHVRFLLDQNKAHLVSYGYPPYGPAVASVAGVDNPFTFNGLFGVRDEGENLFLMQQRFYDAVAGRFLQRDPLGYGAGPNLLAFAAGNPFANADPDGQEIVTLCLFWAGAVLLAGAVAERTVKYLKDREGDELRAQRQLHFTRQENRSATGGGANNAGIEAALNEFDESRQRLVAAAEYTSDSAHYVGDLTYETGKFVAVNKGSDFIGGKLLPGTSGDQLGGGISFGYSAGEEIQSRMPTPPNTENASGSQELAP